MWVGLFVASFFFLVLWSCGASSRVGQVDVSFAVIAPNIGWRFLSAVLLDWYVRGFRV
jgi:hypothetical protein